MKQIRHSLGRIEGKLDLLIPEIQSHQSRIRVLEKKQSRIGGAFALAVLLVTGAFGWMWK